MSRSRFPSISRFPFRISLLLGLVLIPSMMPVKAQKVDFSGFGATGVRVYERNPVAEFNQDFFYEGKLQADIKLSKDIEAQLDFRGSSDDREAVLREFSVKFEYFTYARIKIGNVKKPYSIEGLADRDEDIAVFDSYIHRRNEELGYAGRNVGLLLYYNYKDKRPDFPFSYAAGFFRNNSYVTSAYARGRWHSGNIITSLGYAMLSRSGDDAITTHGVSADIGAIGSAAETTLELFYAQDPEEGIRRRLQFLDEEVYTAGIRSLSAFRFATGGDIVEMIEPYVMLTWYAPDAESTEYHTLEILFGVNLFLDDDVRLRLVADALLTKDRFADAYSTHGSVFATEVFVRF